MTKLQLPTITLLIADDIAPERAKNVLEICKRHADFGAVKLLTSKEVEGAIKIQPLNSLIAYSVFMLTEAYRHVETEHCLVVQRDGFILNPESWKPEWLELDYVAPIFMQTYADGEKVGSGGFSLRSKLMMKRIAHEYPVWDGTQEHAEKLQSRLGFYEDGVISFKHKKNFKIASLEQAADFGQGGNRNIDYYRHKPFGFHRTWQKIDFKTGIVDSSDESRDLCRSYDEEIDKMIL
jgi:hypothetical protein